MAIDIHPNATYDCAQTLTVDAWFQQPINIILEESGLELKLLHAI